MNRFPSWVTTEPMPGNAAGGSLGGADCSAADAIAEENPASTGASKGPSIHSMSMPAEFSTLATRDTMNVPAPTMLPS